MECIEPRWAKKFKPDPLEEGSVHVWRVRSDLGLDRWTELLSAAEKEKLARFRFAPDAARRATGRGALRELLGDYLGLPARDLVFDLERNGKPILAPSVGHVDRNFNVSHSGEWVLLAFTRQSAVGIDIEKWKPLDLLQVAKHSFMAEELAEWLQHPESAREETFFSTWTLKESYLKALGRGLSKDLRSFRVRVAVGEQPALLWCADSAEEAQRWRLQRLDVAPNYSASLAVQSSIDRVHCFTMA
jgi:4'-phosphopantetheinyl transferase